jgi:hypothetical protein
MKENIRLRDVMCGIGDALVELDVHETHGSNRGEVVDRIVLRGGGTLGDPYCCFTFDFIYEVGCKRVGIERAFNPGGSSSALVAKGRALGRITTEPHAGDAVVFLGGPTGYKHTAMAYGDMVDGKIEIIEGNAGNTIRKRIVDTAKEPVVCITVN